LLTTSEIINFDHVSKEYRYRDIQTLKEFLPRFLRRNDPPATFLALDDLTFSVSRGETVGFVGTNGSGKSTALKIVAGITRPSSGSATVMGRVAPLLQLGAGFHGDLTGRENIFLNGCILGLTDDEIRVAIPDIVAFADLHQFLDSPVKHYSSGMYLRLAFSVAVHAQPDILIVDEALSVGDAAFQAKCLAHIRKMRAAGVTLLFVSHSHVMVEQFCDKAILLERGKMLMIGTPKDVLKRYDEVLGKTNPPVEEVVL
jgi:lipopolysaccharide transport system ATP-binding protein